MAEITREAVQEKLDKGETLTKEETSFVMSLPPDGVAERASDDDGEDIFKDAEEIGPDGKAIVTDKTSQDDKDKKAAEEKAAKEKADADEAAKKKSEEEAKAKAETDKAVKEKSDGDSFYGKVEKDLALSDKDVNLEGYSEREKGLYWALRKERKDRQQAEADRDAERFDRIKRDKIAAEQAKKAKEEEPDEDDEAFLTKGELKKREREKEEARQAEEAANTRKVILRTQGIAAHGIVEARKVKGEELPDYDKTMAIGEVLVQDNPEMIKKIQDAWADGKNAALVTYDIVRNDPRFKSLYNPGEAPKPAEKKEEKPPEKKDEGKENLKKIDENTKKPKTSGAEGGAGAQGDYGEYTFDQLVKMSTSDFRKVPKGIREKFLKDVG